MASPSMETISDDILTQAFAQVDISQSESSSKPHSFHLLNIEAPAHCLLPTSEHEGWETMPYIYPPNDVILYCPPPLDRKAVGITDTSFWTVFPIQDVKIQPYQNTHLYMDLVQAILELSKAEGASRLEVVCLYHPGYQDLVYRFQLTTSWHRAPKPQWFQLELSSVQWSMLIAHSKNIVWIGLLKNLMHRESYRAHYHIRDALNKHYGPGAAAFEQSQWARNGPLVKGSTAWNRILSCCFQLKSSSEWNPLEHEPVNRIDGPITVTNMTVLMALGVALRSLTPVPSVCPEALSPAMMLHTKLVEQEFADLLYHTEDTRSLTPPQLYRQLQGLALHTVIDPKTNTKLLSVKRLPGWNTFLCQWLTRAVNFIAERRCDDPSHTGLHAHGPIKYYNPTDWTYDAEKYLTVANFAREMEEEKAMMKDLEDMIERATLGI